MTLPDENSIALDRSCFHKDLLQVLMPTTSAVVAKFMRTMAGYPCLTDLR